MTAPDPYEGNTAMPIRSTLLFASAAALGLSAPAFAQDERYDSLPPLEDEYVEAEVQIERDHPAYEGGWEGEWVDSEHYQGEWEGTYHRDGYAAQDHHGNEHHSSHHGPRLAYSAAEREAWLADCRVLMYDGGGYGYDDGYYEVRRGPDGRIIGGVLGAVAGGIAGNRIADGNRTAGTLIGAGLGGLAGAAIGDAVDGDRRGHRYSRDYDDYDANELWAARYCEAYLRRYELGGGADYYGHGQGMMMVQAQPVHRRRHRNCRPCDAVVTEEIVEVEEVVEVRRPARRVVQRRAPAPTPVKTKRLRAD